MTPFSLTAKKYSATLSSCLEAFDWSPVATLAATLERARELRSDVFLFGNGGSAANAIHWANDLIYPITKQGGAPLRAHALSANQATATCLGNDIGYDRIFEFQLRAFAKPGDIVIALSGSGNSPNILRALEFSGEAGLTSFAIVGYDGGKAKALASVPIHLPVDNMQIAEDFQMIVCHIILQHLNINTGVKP